MKIIKMVVFGVVILFALGIAGFYLTFRKAFTEIGKTGDNTPVTVVPTKTLAESIGDLDSCTHNDEVLCGFIARGRETEKYYAGGLTHRNTQIAADDKTTITYITIDAEGHVRYQQSLDKRTTYDQIMIDGTLYERDLSTPVLNGKWAVSEMDDGTMKLYGEGGSYLRDVISEYAAYAEKGKAERTGTEKCGKDNCFIYRITTETIPGRTDTYYISDKEYRLVKHKAVNADGSEIDAEFTYENIDVKKPDGIQ